jgi:hypothetical protein
MEGHDLDTDAKLMKYTIQGGNKDCQIMSRKLSTLCKEGKV